MDQPAPDAINPQPNEQPKPRKRGTNVPIPIVVGIICLGLGIAGGIVLAEFVGEQKKAAANGSGDGTGAEEGDGKAPGGKGPGGKGPGGKGPAGKGPGGKGPGGGGGGGGGFSKIQLTQLVTVLDSLTAKPPMFQLSAEEKKQLAEQLAGLEAKEALTNEEAQTKLNAVTKLLEPHKNELLAAGFLWPGPPPKGGDANANPLKDNERLKSLQSTLGK